MPDLSTVVNMFFGADNNKVLYALIAFSFLLMTWIAKPTQTAKRKMNVHTENQLLEI